MTALAPILIVDDDPNDAELLREALRRQRLANPLVFLRDGDDVLDYLLRRGAHAARTGPDPILVLLDLMMPRVDGFEVLRKLREAALPNGPRVAVLTSSMRPDDVNESYRLEADAYCVKPLDFVQFQSVVADVGLGWALVPVGGREPRS